MNITRTVMHSHRAVVLHWHHQHGTSDPTSVTEDARKLNCIKNRVENTAHMSVNSVQQQKVQEQSKEPSPDVK